MSCFCSAEHSCLHCTSLEPDITAGSPELRGRLPSHSNCPSDSEKMMTEGEEEESSVSDSSVGSGSDRDVNSPDSLAVRTMFLATVSGNAATSASPGASGSTWNDKTFLEWLGRAIDRAIGAGDKRSAARSFWQEFVTI